MSVPFLNFLPEELYNYIASYLYDEIADNVVNMVKATLRPVDKKYYNTYRFEFVNGFITAQHIKQSVLLTSFYKRFMKLTVDYVIMYNSVCVECKKNECECNPVDCYSCKGNCLYLDPFEICTSAGMLASKAKRARRSETADIVERTTRIMERNLEIFSYGGCDGNTIIRFAVHEEGDLKCSPYYNEDMMYYLAQYMLNNTEYRNKRYMYRATINCFKLFQ
ncbi:orf53 [Sucra jujuba nucleopolyhedrovirus]|uniref:Orf53 n=1 Tax=Sucra jujuba nucleopolyhedrovirus TaxID=1563660 RepID=A0A097P8Y6_9ABAC|nr:orf53 [Sucra jujuba nucleopolyhedrovirus]AIU41292.1 orf53 [Sucra jujuba nucleopolyhedrovirus]